MERQNVKGKERTTGSHRDGEPAPATHTGIKPRLVGAGRETEKSDILSTCLTPRPQ
jgi:hypothetical protein